MINFHIKAIINRLVERGERGRTDILFRDTRVPDSSENYQHNRYQGSACSCSSFGNAYSLLLWRVTSPAKINVTLERGYLRLSQPANLAWLVIDTKLCLSANRTPLVLTFKKDKSFIYFVIKFQPLLSLYLTPIAIIVQSLVDFHRVYHVRLCYAENSNRGGNLLT